MLFGVFDGAFYMETFSSLRLGVAIIVNFRQKYFSVSCTVSRMSYSLHAWPNSGKASLWANKLDQVCWELKHEILEVSRSHRAGAKKLIHRKLMDACTTHIELQYLKPFFYKSQLYLIPGYVNWLLVVLFVVILFVHLQFCVKHCFMRLHLLLICYETVSLNI